MASQTQQQAIESDIEIDNISTDVSYQDVDLQTSDWTKVISHRKRTNSGSSSDNRPNKIAQVCRPTPIFNKFSPLAKTVTDDDKPNVIKTTKVPPIFLKSTVNYVELCKLLKGILGNDQFTCSSTLNGITIHPMTPESYRKIVQVLRQNDAEFHTFQLPEEKVFRVVIRGLHASIDPEIIKDELISHGYAVRNVTNIWSYKKNLDTGKKIPLPLFFVDLEPGKVNDKIFDLTMLLYSKIQVEEPRPKRVIVQCMRCQQFGHTKKYCNLAPKCVRCGKNHESTSCTKSKETPATCALCGGNHPANYRGCSVHRELQNRRSTKTKSINDDRQTQTQSEPPRLTESSYPTLPQRQQYTANTDNETLATDLPRSNHDAEHSYAKRVQNVSPPATSDNSNIVSQLTSVVTEFKNLITPLITLMTQLMQVLISKHDK